MSSKVQKEDIGYLDVSRNHIRADHLTANPDLHENVKTLHKTFTRFPKDTILKVLLSCENDIEAATKRLRSEDGTKEALDQWEVAKGKGKGKPLTATKSRKNKKPSSSPQSVLVNGELPNGYDHSLKNGLSASPVESMPSLKNVSNHDSHKVIHPPPLPQREHHKVDRHGDENKSKEQSTFADKKHLSGPNTLCVAEATVKPVPILASTDSGTHSDNPHIPPGEAGREKRQDSRGRLDSTASTGSASGSGDSTKRLMKDLTRCHVSLSRHQTNLNERCDASARLIRQVFNNLKSLVVQREEELERELDQVRRNSSRVLEERRATAGNLKARGDLLTGMNEAEATHFKAQIKAFITDRKVDEEIGSISRFQCDPDSLFQEVSSFGSITNICHTYTSWHSGQLLTSNRTSSGGTSSKPSLSSNTTSLKPAKKTQPSSSGGSGVQRGPALSSGSSGVQRGPVGKVSSDPHDVKASQARVRDAVIKQGVVLDAPGEDGVTKPPPSGRGGRKKRGQQRKQDGQVRQNDARRQGKPQDSPATWGTGSISTGPLPSGPTSSVGSDIPSQTSRKHPTGPTSSVGSDNPSQTSRKHPTGPTSSVGSDNPSQTSRKHPSSQGPRRFEESVIIVHDRNRLKPGKPRSKQPQPAKQPADTEGEEPNKKGNSKPFAGKRKKNRKSKSPPLDQAQPPKPDGTKVTVDSELPESTAADRDISSSSTTNGGVPISTTADREIPNPITPDSEVPSLHTTDGEIPISTTADQEIPNHTAPDIEVPSSPSTDGEAPSSPRTDKEIPNSTTGYEEVTVVGRSSSMEDLKLDTTENNVDELTEVRPREDAILSLSPEENTLDKAVEGNSPPRNGDHEEVSPSALANINNNSNNPPPRNGGPEESQLKVMFFEDGSKGKGKGQKLIRKQSLKITPSQQPSRSEEESFTLKVRDNVED